MNGFKASDVAVVNGSVGAVTGAGSGYPIAIGLSGTGDVTVSIPENGTLDTAWNGNLASASVRVADRTVQNTQRFVAGFTQARATQLMNNKPNLIAPYRGQPSGQLDLDVSGGNMNLDFATRPTSPLWFHLKSGRSKYGDVTNQFAHVAAGRDIAIAPFLSFGEMEQFGHQQNEKGGLTFERTGWLVRPYFVGRHPNHPLFFSASALFGQTSNIVSPFGTYVDDFETTRGLLSVGVAGILDWARAT